MEIMEVKFEGINLHNKKVYIKTNPNVYLNSMPISELDYCLQNFGSENGILKGKFEKIEYRGYNTILCVGSPKYKQAIKTLNKKLLNK